MVSGVHGVITHLAAKLVEEVFRLDIDHASEVTIVMESLKTLSTVMKRRHVVIHMVRLIKIS